MKERILWMCSDPEGAISIQWWAQLTWWNHDELLHATHQLTQTLRMSPDPWGEGKPDFFLKIQNSSQPESEELFLSLISLFSAYKALCPLLPGWSHSVLCKRLLYSWIANKSQLDLCLVWLCVPSRCSTLKQELRILFSKKHWFPGVHVTKSRAKIFHVFPHVELSPLSESVETVLNLFPGHSGFPGQQNLPHRGPLDTVLQMRERPQTEIEVIIYTNMDHLGIPWKTRPWSGGLNCAYSLLSV